MAIFEPKNMTIRDLGKAVYPSPIQYSRVYGDGRVNFIREEENRVTIPNSFPSFEKVDRRFFQKEYMMERAGPRDKIFFAPEQTNAAIITCGGLCPGLNDVIRSLVNHLWRLYGVKSIKGIRYGYQGLLRYKEQECVELNPEIVRNIHKQGGTILASSRGGGDQTDKLVDALQDLKINILFVIGGDGSQRGALDMSEEIIRRGLKIAVVGIPKTVDNDLSYVHKTFGFETAVAISTNVVRTAYVEATGVYNGVGLVKLMGRLSGFIAAHTALATHVCNFVLVPEVPFDLYGEKGFLQQLEKRLLHQHYAVVVVAEGAGQNFLPPSGKKDASGNTLLSDVGHFLKKEIEGYFEKKGDSSSVKYFDPSYIIRATPATAYDACYCSRLGSYAVHAAMAGKTGMMVSLWNGVYVHVPILPAVSERNVIDAESSLWRDVLEATAQPIDMRN